MAFFRQFFLLLWKNWVLQKRKKCVTVFEVLMPTCMAILLVVTRRVTRTEDKPDPIIFDDFNIDAMLHSGYSDTAVLYAPDNMVTRAIMRRVEESLKNRYQYQTAKGIAFSDEKSLLSHYRQLGNRSRSILTALIFDGDFAENTEDVPKHITLKIRPTYKYEHDKWKTDSLYDFYFTTQPRSEYSTYGGNPDYYERGFLSVQYAVLAAIIEHQNPSVNVSKDVKVSLQMMPYPPYYIDYYLPMFQIALPLVIMLSFILNTLQTTKNVVFEKERKLKESMKMMGLSNFTHWSAWFFKCFIYLLLAMILYTILLNIPVSEDGHSVIGRSDGSLFFVFLLCYAVSIVSFSFLISVFFKKANNGAAASGILFILTYCPYFALQSQYQYMSQTHKLATCLLSNLAMAFGCNVFALYEGTGEGAHWDNFYRPATRDDNFSLLFAMIMLLVDSIIYLLITWYIDAVFPGEFGVPQPFYFPVLKSYWCGTATDVLEIDEGVNSYLNNDENEFFEKDPSELSLGICIRNLKKVFGRGNKKKVAVNGMSLNMYKGQITALLGHNGAGKTTTMSMLTGFMPVSGGTAIVNGFDINRNIAGVRENLGLCPQHDILFDTLTVTEHLIFFAKLKGTPSHTIQHEVDTMVEVVGLQGKEDALSMTLSGGQKRKLSVGIALIGGSQVIILDEPTSGMDPQARRQIWSILQQYKENRTILFTTHYMDEADILGDRIAIMAEGVVKCCGTSLFLKGKYGSGYHLTIVKETSCDIAAITELIHGHVPSAELKGNIGAELSYILPSDESPKFEQLFQDMEIHAQTLGIASFGASVTTMEEVFLRVGESAVDDPEDTIGMKGTKQQGTNDTQRLYSSTMELANGINMSHEFLGFNQDLEMNTGMTLNLQQFQAAFVKKVIHTWRNPVVTIVQLLLPIAFTCLALGIDKISINKGEEPALALSLSTFKLNHVAHSFDLSAEAANLDEKFLSTFKASQSTAEQVDPSKYNMTAYYVNKGKDIGVTAYNNLYLIGGSFHSQTASDLELRGYFNGQPYHMNAIVLSSLMNTLLKYYIDDEASVLMVNHPLPRPVKEDENQYRSAPGIGISFSISFCILFGMAFLCSSFVLFIIRERKSQAKHIQIISGLRPLTFWLANFSWDFINYLIPCLCLLVVFVAFQTEAYAFEGRLGYIFVILLLYGWAILPFVYMFSFLFKTPAGGMVALVTLNIITGLVLLLVIFILSIIPEERDTAETLRWVFGSILPNYCMGQSFMDFYTNYQNYKLCGPDYMKKCEVYPTGSCCEGCTGYFCAKFHQNYLAWDSPGVGRYILFMGLQGIFYFSLVLLVEYGVFRKIWYTLGPHPLCTAMAADQNEDADVAQECARIHASDAGTMTDSLILQNLSKYYGGHLAVERLCLGIPKTECFGLLGVNGAGKTTTFKMLTGEELVSDGNAFINGFDVRQNLQMVHQSIGYCPQFDALIDQMTGRETLTMYARLRGIRRDRIGEVVRELMQTLCFEEYADKEVGFYSGGNKRKLSTAIALIGDPPVIFLDEPTTGVDPAARRQLWNVLSNIRTSGRTLILTSHSMEECDALCTRIAIMVNGRFLCLGSSQHLKNKFGQGYTLIARVGESNGEGSQLAELESFIESTFPNSQKVDSSNGYVNYHLIDPNLSLSYIFGTLERAKQQYNIEDYSVSQTTLQQVFIAFAKSQIPPREKPSSLCKTTCCLCCCC